MDTASNKTLSYRALIEGSLKVSAFLRDIGIVQGDVVSLFAPNCLEFPLIVYGCFYLGVTVNACNPTYTGEEVRHVLELTKPKVIFTAANALPKILAVSAGKACDFIQDIVSLECSSSAQGKVWLFEDILRNKRIQMESTFKPPQVNMSDTVGLIQMSSGTTGLLKAVVNTQENMLTAMATSV